MSTPPVSLRGAFLIPTYNAGPLLGQVLADLRQSLARRSVNAPIVVVDDGSTDDTFADPHVPEGVVLLRHPHNRGKGAALLTGFAWAAQHDLDFVVTLDADRQHPSEEALTLFTLDADPDALVLGIRDLRSAGAPRANQWSNAFSNRVLSLFGGQPLSDTQCGLRRYPIRSILKLGARHPGYALESDLVLRAARRGVPIVEVPTGVHYPAEEERVSHFDSVRDPAKIVLQVVLTTLTVPHVRLTRRAGEWGILLTLLGLITLPFLL